jgi:uroporphyrinogen-III synthase
MNSLAGAAIINTRSAMQAMALSDLLIERGARPLSFPCIAIAPPDDPRPLRDALAMLQSSRFDWIVFTSANAVTAVSEALGDRGLPAGVRVAAVGEATAEMIRSRFQTTSIVVPARHTAEGLVADLDIKIGERVFLPLSSIARAALADGLRAAGAIVTGVPAYQTQTGKGGVDLGPILAGGEVDAIAFASPSAVDGFLGRIGALGFRIVDVNAIPIACIGPTTADRAGQRGFQTIVISSDQTAAGLVDALETALAPVHKGVVRCP